jgi:hypothetical protein
MVISPPRPKMRLSPADSAKDCLLVDGGDSVQAAMILKTAEHVSSEGERKRA